MLNPVDTQMLQSMLGVEELPAGLVEECELRTRMYHAAGHSGPLGALGLIPAVRAAGYGPPKPQSPAPDAVDWSLMPADGRTRIEAQFGGLWHMGSYVGPGPDGEIAVKLLESGDIMLCRRHMLRLVKVLTPEEVFWEQEDAERRMQVELAAELEARQATDMMSLEQAEDAEFVQIGPAPEDEPEEPSVPEPVEEEGPTNWRMAPTGAAVYVGDDCDEGTFEGCRVEDGELKALLVKFTGAASATEVDPAEVLYAGDPPALDAD